MKFPNNPISSDASGDAWDCQPDDDPWGHGASPPASDQVGTDSSLISAGFRQFIHPADFGLTDDHLQMWRWAEAHHGQPLGAPQSAAKPHPLPTPAAAQAETGFIPARTFSGALEGFVFTTRDGKCGYFRDGMGSGQDCSSARTPLVLERMLPDTSASCPQPAFPRRRPRPAHSQPFTEDDGLGTGGGQMAPGLA